MDVINMISKDQRFPDAEATIDPSHKFQPGWKYFVNGLRLHEYLREMNREVLSKYDSITVGEMPGVSDVDEILRTVGSNAGELNMIFIFDVVDIDKPNVRMALKPWDVHELKRLISKWQRAMIERDGWNSVFTENHDNPRSISRYTDDSGQFRDKGAKLLALMHTTLSGTLFVYQGEEIGIRNAGSDWDIETEYKDIETINYWKKCKALYGEDEDRLAHGRKVIQMKARDHSRTPMQWKSGPNAGFCAENVKPWMRVMDDYRTINAEDQIKANGDTQLSVWQFWQRCLLDRKEHKEAFVYGDFQEISPENESIFAYGRMSESGERWLVVLNFSGKRLEYQLPVSLAVDFWARGTYTRGKAQKPVKGSITAQAVGRSTRKMQGLVVSHYFQRLLKPTARPPSPHISDLSKVIDLCSKEKLPIIR